MESWKGKKIIISNYILTIWEVRRWNGEMIKYFDKTQRPKQIDKSAIFISTQDPPPLPSRPTLAVERTVGWAPRPHSCHWAHRVSTWHQNAAAVHLSQPVSDSHVPGWARGGNRNNSAPLNSSSGERFPPDPHRRWVEIDQRLKCYLLCVKQLMAFGLTLPLCTRRDKKTRPYVFT